MESDKIEKEDRKWGEVQNQVIRTGFTGNMAVEVRKQSAQTSRSNMCKGPETGGQCAWSKAHEREREERKRGQRSNKEESKRALWRNEDLSCFSEQGGDPLVIWSKGVS